MKPPTTISEQICIETILATMLRKGIIEPDDVQTFTIYLTDFAVIFRSQNGIQAMVDYLFWEAAHGDYRDMIEATLFHDIYGRNDRCFSPRTSGYLNVQKG